MTEEIAKQLRADSDAKWDAYKQAEQTIKAEHDAWIAAYRKAEKADLLMEAQREQSADQPAAQQSSALTE